MLSAQPPTAPHNLSTGKAPSTLMEPAHKAPAIVADPKDKFMEDFLRDGVRLSASSPLVIPSADQDLVFTVCRLKERDLCRGSSQVRGQGS